jgi:hypothetical protein
MIRDPIVEEIHRIRKKMLEECGGDFDKLFERLKAAEANDKDRLVSGIRRRKKRATPAR